MNESPGWTSPGPSPSDPSGDRDRDQDRDQTASGNAPKAPAQQQPTGWSAQQPPPASQGWGVPGAPQPGQQPGQPGGWNTNWQQAPAAKPGVIPLRPLGVGEILDGAVSTMRAHWRPVLGIALGVAVVIQLVSTVVTGVWFRDNGSLEALQNNPNPTTDEILDAVNGTLSSQSITLLATMLGTVIATALLTIVVSRAVLGRPVSIGEAWREARPLLLRLLGLSFLVLLIVIGALVLGFVPGLLLAAAGSPGSGAALGLLGGLGGIVVAVWLWVRFALSAPALMLERQGVITSLRRSAKLVRGSWWRIFGILALTLILVTVIEFIVSIPTALLAAIVGGEGVGGLLTGEVTSFTWPYLIVIGIGAVIAATITLPLSAGVTALLYIDRRIRREALDLELARAAGVPGYTTQQPGDSAPGS
ncbi:DUF7544 domain-containing protein [Streptomyces gobiensis]|uniref:DUF7544 domain-containing protein n=1 Tax=Streptomyces gobiensis TaxID=2875706 RepID=UPI001E56B4C9|nr:hypothetical protein [Streptomyces gobiensis]UGY91744.1 hypothetical protein test1122_08425 [Streptomyces gobiensis]